MGKICAPVTGSTLPYKVKTTAGAETTANIGTPVHYVSSKTRNYRVSAYVFNYSFCYATYVFVVKSFHPLHMGLAG